MLKLNNLILIWIVLCWKQKMIDKMRFIFSAIIINSNLVQLYLLCKKINKNDKVLIELETIELHVVGYESILFVYFLSH